ncbi:UNVERIFIED_CONTAM: 23S rRNA (uracil(1939)-C(5))-methyltransferase RlmD [Campylobacter lari]
MNKYDCFTSNKDKLRQITARYSDTFDELLLIFDITNDIKFDNEFLYDIKYNFPMLKTIVVVNNYSFIRSYISNETFIKDKIGDLVFKINYNSFFQINSFQTNNLYNLLLTNLPLKKSDTVLDAYCGIGTITLKVAPKVKKIVGIELVKDAIANAKENAKLNNIYNAEFYSGDVISTIDKIKEKFDVIIVDPPRAGLDIRFLNKLIEMNPKAIGYISCNPHTLCRDVDLLTKGGYKIKTLIPCDMFSQTHHIEVVTVLTKE